MVILLRHFGTLRTCVQIEVQHEFTHELRSLEGMDILVKGVPFVVGIERKGRTTNFWRYAFKRLWLRN